MENQTSCKKKKIKKKIQASEFFPDQSNPAQSNFSEGKSESFNNLNSAVIPKENQIQMK